jgi:translation initiation factor eIF-2B subunit epsilon
MGNDQDNKHNQKLQAVLLADSFQTTFQPISLDNDFPKMLCPLNNVTMIDYAIEYLSGAGVEELYIFCASGSDAIEDHIQKKSFSKSSSSMQIKCVRDASVTDAGSALRELYNKNLIQSDPFILMSGDVVTNADIGPAMEEHKARHKKDNSAIMTALLKRVGGWNATATGSSGGINAKVSSLQSLNEDLTVALAPPPSSSLDTHSRVFLYDTNPNSTTTQLPTSFFTTTSSIELFNDLIDCGIYICSPDVLAKFSDEWDYLDIKTFISNSVAEEEEGLQTKIYAKQLSSSEYAARIRDFRSYHAVSNDLLKRWCYPIVPDNLPSGYEKIYRYGVERHMMYVEQKGKTKVGKCVTLKGPGMVGSHTKIKDSCVVTSTVVGNDCFIGENVTLENCHLWDGVQVEDGASVTESILCHGCVVKRGAVIAKGCIIGQACIIGENVVLPAFTRITNNVDEDEDDAFQDEEDDDDDDNNNSALVSDHDVVGTDGVGRVWTPSDDDGDFDSEDDNDNQGTNNKTEQMKTQSIGYDATNLLRKRLKNQIEDDNLLDVNGLDDRKDDYDDSHGNLMSNVDEDGMLIYGRQADVDVVRDLKQMCLEFTFSSSIQNLSMEMKAFKFSQNATFSDCVTGAIFAILERLKVTSDTTTAAFIHSFMRELGKWKEALVIFLVDKTGNTEEISIINAIETAAVSGGVIGSAISKETAFRLMLQALYNDDLISDEAVLSWAEVRRNDDEDSAIGMLFNQKSTQEFVDWVGEDSSSSSSDEDGSDGSDSDDD